MLGDENKAILTQVVHWEKPQHISSAREFHHPQCDLNAKSYIEMLTLMIAMKKELICQAKKQVSSWQTTFDQVFH